jgi:uncharacterized protein (DUF1800 family)
MIRLDFPLHGFRLQSATPARRACLLVVVLLLIVPACGGSSGGGGGGDQLEPPGPVSYSAPTATYTTDEPILPNVPLVGGGTPDTWTISPDLPQGLTFDGGSGVISGTPIAPDPSTVYTVDCSNAVGSAQAQVTLDVIWHESKSLAQKASFTDADIRHFMERTHFGFVQANWDVIQTAGMPAYVDAITTFADTTQLENDGLFFFIADPNFPGEAAISRWWQYLVLLNPNVFQEQLALHWHDHFATSTAVLSGNNRYYFLDHINLLRHEGAGNVRQLLLALARDWAMLEWLDGVRNNGAPGNEPNENFAREWFELFTLGVDVVYTQTDIVEAARAFTGYVSRFDVGTGQNFVEFNPARHDAGDKTVLGVLIPGQSATDDYAAVVDITLAARAPGSTVSATAQWLVRSLLEYFCYRDPPQNVIDELAADLENGGWELKPVLMKMLLSEAFYSARGRVGLVKGPMEHLFGFTHTTGLLDSPANLDNRLTIMGHRPSQPPTVDGWTTGTQWFSAQAMLERANMLNQLTVVAKPLQDALNIDVMVLLPSPTATSMEVVDALCLRLQVDLPADERTTCANYLDSSRTNSGVVTRSAFETVGLAEQEQRLRGLLWILGQHPLYQVR